VQLPVQDEVVQAASNELAEQSNEDSRTNTIYPTFLEALPEDLRAEVLASQQVQSTRAANYAPPPAEEIDEQIHPFNREGANNNKRMAPRILLCRDVLGLRDALSKCLATVYLQST
jgi:hypothetical protein